MNWLEQLAGAPGILAHGGIAAAVLLETGLFPTGADFLLILLVASRPEEWWIVFLAAAVGSICTTRRRARARPRIDVVKVVQ